jgi:hypothetical protein
VLVGNGAAVIVTTIVETSASAVPAQSKSAMLVGRRCIAKSVGYICLYV